MSQQMTLDTEALAAGINQISLAVDDIAIRSQRFLQLIDEKNAQTKNRFALTLQLKPVIQEQAEKLQKIVQTVELIKESVRKYTDLAEEALDTGFLTMN